MLRYSCGSNFMADGAAIYCQKNVHWIFSCFQSVWTCDLFTDLPLVWQIYSPASRTEKNWHKNRLQEDQLCIRIIWRRNEGQNGNTKIQMCKETESCTSNVAIYCGQSFKSNIGKIKSQEKLYNKMLLCKRLKLLMHSCIKTMF